METSVISVIKQFGGMVFFAWTLSLFSSTLFTILALAAVTLVYFYEPLWHVRHVPGPLVLPLVGHLHLFSIHGIDLFTILANRYGPVFRMVQRVFESGMVQHHLILIHSGGSKNKNHVFHMGRQPLIIVADAELCREAGIKKFKQITNRTMPSPIMASPIHQKGLLWIRDQRWSTMRNSILSVYQPSHLATLVPMMQSYVEAIAQNIPEDEDIKFNELTLKIASDVIGKAAFGSDFGLCQPDQHQRVDEDVDSFLKQHIYSTSMLKMTLSGSMSILLGLLLPILQEPFRHIFENIPYTTDWKLDRTNKSLTNLLDKIVDSKMRDKERGSSDFLSLILNARESNSISSKLFTPDYITGLTYEHLLAGSTTTSFTMSCAVYLISGHPEVEQKLLEEIDAFGPCDKVPTADDLQSRFPYLDQVVKETMRFYTVSPLVAREAATDVLIGDYAIPKGTAVWLSLGVPAKDPINFPEPERFKPDRFDPNGDEEKQRHPYAHIPFGIGPRACIGQKFSLQEIKLALIHLYRKYVFRHSPNMKTPLEFEYGLILNFKHGVIVRAIKRI